MAVGLLRRVLYTRMTAFVEPPEGDLDLMARDGGWRLILARASVCAGVDEERKRKRLLCTELRGTKGVVLEQLRIWPCPRNQLVDPDRMPPTLAVSWPNESLTRRLVSGASLLHPFPLYMAILSFTTYSAQRVAIDTNALLALIGFGARRYHRQPNTITLHNKLFACA